MQKQGFTLIELLVVIVIIGILATISVATFSGYFKKARDAERKTVVSNAATLLKTARAVSSVNDFGTDLNTKVKVDAILSSEGGYDIPAGNNYYMIAAADDFAIYTCSEEKTGVNEIYVDGTATAVTDVKLNKATICGSGTPVYTTKSDADGDGTDETPFALQ